MDFPVAEAAPMLKALAPFVLDRMKSAMGVGVDRIRASFASTFRDHLEATKRKSSYVTTISWPDNPTLLRDIYVNLYLLQGEDRLRDDELLAHVAKHRALLIRGTAGAGKSMLMRYVSLLSIEEGVGKIPLFIELKDLPSITEMPFIEGLFRLVTPETQRHNRTIFDEALKAGAFILFLDGMDEVPPIHREIARREIEELIRRFPDLQVIMSSRPEIDFSGWREFAKFEVAPLGRAQTRMVIDRAQYADADIKTRFIAKLDAGEFDKYDSFLEVPLLSVILLLCFGEYLELTDVSTSFYDQAYEVLYRRHDRTKGLKRKHFSQLSPDNFRKILAAFCYRTLLDHALSFTEDELVNYIYKACKISAVDADCTAFALDLVESVSLLIRDGSKLYWTHRSFQEYFSAQFIARYRGAEARRVYDALLSDSFANLVAGMVKELDQVGMEREWVEPALAEALPALESGLNKGLTEFIGTMVDHITFAVEGDELFIQSYGWSGSKRVTRLLLALSNVYDDAGLNPAVLTNVNPIPRPDDTATGKDYALPFGLGQILTSGRNGESYTLRIGPEINDWFEYIGMDRIAVSLLGRLRQLEADVKARASTRESLSVFD